MSSYSAYSPFQPGMRASAAQTPLPDDAGAGPGPGMEREWDPVVALQSLARAWRLIAGSVLLAVLLAWTVVSFWPREYTAETLVLLDPRNQPNLQLDEVMAGLAPDDQTISSEVLILQSASLAAKVVADLSLTDDPQYNPLAANTRGFWAALWPEDLWQRLFRSAGVGALGGAANLAAPEAVLEAAEVRVLQAFADRLEVERVGRSHAIRVAFTARSPEQAADVANGLADRYLEGQLSVKFEAHGLAQDWLTQRVDELQQNVEAAEQAVEEYRTRSGLIDNNGVTVANQQMGEISTRLIAARADTAAARARLAQVKSLIGQNGDALSAAEVLSSPLIHRLKEQEVEVLRHRADLSQEYGPSHPRMLSVEAELADIRDRIMGEVRQIVAGLKNEVAVAVAQEQALADDLARLEGKTAEQNQAEVRLRALEREAEASRNLLETFLARIKETRHQEAIQRSDARILSSALPPLKPSSPRVILVLAAAALLSFIAVALYVLVSSSRSRGIENLAFIREQLGLQVLATVPKVSAWRAFGRPGLGRRGREQRDQMVESAAAFAAMGLGDASTVLVTAVEPGSTSPAIAAAIARVFARQEGDVLLVDGEFANAAFSDRLGLGGANGLADVLGGEDIGPLPTAPSGIAGLRVLSAGSINARSRLPMSPSAFDARWTRIRDASPRIILHGGPVLAAPEARLLARRCDGVVLLARWADTPVAMIAEAAAAVRDAGGTIAGIIVTEADPDAAPAVAMAGRPRPAATNPFQAGKLSLS